MKKLISIVSWVLLLIPMVSFAESYQFDELQELFISLTSETTATEFESAVKKTGLPYAKQEFNKSGSGKDLSYIVAFTESAAHFKYAESGDKLHVSFDTGNNSRLMTAQYSNAQKLTSALFYQYGVWYSFNFDEENDYSGYYYIHHFGDDDGVELIYDNGYHKKTKYIPYSSAEDVLNAVMTYDN